MPVTVHPRTREIHRLLQLDEQGMRAIAQAAAAAFRKAEAEMFAAEKDSRDQPWTALTPAYKAWKDAWFSGMRAKHRVMKAALPAAYMPKARGFGANKTLQLTGGMKAAFTKPGGENVVEWFRAGKHWRIRLGVSGRAAKLATWHFTGTSRMAPRPPIVEPGSPHAAKVLRAMEGALFAWFTSRVRALARATGASSYGASQFDHLFSAD